MKWEVVSKKYEVGSVRREAGEEKRETRSERQEARAETIFVDQKSTINQFGLWDLKIDSTEVNNSAKATIGIGFLMPSGQSRRKFKNQEGFRVFESKLNLNALLSTATKISLYVTYDIIEIYPSTGSGAGDSAFEGGGGKSSAAAFSSSPFPKNNLGGRSRSLSWTRPK